MNNRKKYKNHEAYHKAAKNLNHEIFCIPNPVIKDCANTLIGDITRSANRNPSNAHLNQLADLMKKITQALLAQHAHIPVQQIDLTSLIIQFAPNEGPEELLDEVSRKEFFAKNPPEEFFSSLQELWGLLCYEHIIYQQLIYFENKTIIQKYINAESQLMKHVFKLKEKPELQLQTELILDHVQKIIKHTRKETDVVEMTKVLRSTYKVLSDKPAQKDVTQLINLGQQYSRKNWLWSLLGKSLMVLGGLIIAAGVALTIAAAIPSLGLAILPGCGMLLGGITLFAAGKKIRTKHKSLSNQQELSATLNKTGFSLKS